jgi:hypothetical protein
LGYRCGFIPPSAYEKFVESTVHAFCEISEKAVIVSANQLLLRHLMNANG